MAPASGPVFVIVPGASQTPSHYAFLIPLLQSRGYGTLTALLPSRGATRPVSAGEDAEFIRSRMLLPLLDTEKHNVVLVMHSYNGLPGSAAAWGLGKADRAAQGKMTSVLGQIFIAAILPRGDDGSDVIATLGGRWPPFIDVYVQQSWIIRDMATGHSPQLAAPETLTDIILDLAQQFGGLPHENGSVPSGVSAPYQQDNALEISDASEE
ncbi:hypothetical protein MMC17_006943 [Xylographa soralifera]|nr:hypothetical protein [Xylographa soralifera]